MTRPITEQNSLAYYSRNPPPPSAATEGSDWSVGKIPSSVKFTMHNAMQTLFVLLFLLINGTVSQDFYPRFFLSKLVWAPDWLTKKFGNMDSISQRCVN